MKQVRCDKCGTLYEDDRTDCKNCGAPYKDNPVVNAQPTYDATSWLQTSGLYAFPYGIPLMMGSGGIGAFYTTGLTYDRGSVYDGANSICDNDPNEIDGGGVTGRRHGKVLQSLGVQTTEHPGLLWRIRQRVGELLGVVDWPERGW
jgi:hypothetical protein